MTLDSMKLKIGKLNVKDKYGNWWLLVSMEELDLIDRLIIENCEQEVKFMLRKLAPDILETIHGKYQTMDKRFGGIPELTNGYMKLHWEEKIKEESS